MNAWLDMQMNISDLKVYLNRYSLRVIDTDFRIIFSLVHVDWKCEKLQKLANAVKSERQGLIKRNFVSITCSKYSFFPCFNFATQKKTLRI